MHSKRAKVRAKGKAKEEKAVKEEMAASREKEQAKVGLEFWSARRVL